MLTKADIDPSQMIFQQQGTMPGWMPAATGRSPVRGLLAVDRGPPAEWDRPDVRIQAPGIVGVASCRARTTLRDPDAEDRLRQRRRTYGRSRHARSLLNSGVLFPASAATVFAGYLEGLKGPDFADQVRKIVAGLLSAYRHMPRPC